MVVSMDRWVGKVAVVTGASSGIGAAIAEQLVKNGLIVAGVARRVDLVQEKAKKLSKEKGKLHGVQADFSKEAEITKAFKWITENLGPVHILINNAGFGGGTTNLTGDDADTETWRKIFDLNVLGLSIATKEAVNIMTKNKINGHVIHINAVLGHRLINIPGLNVYPASKFAVTALTENLRQELNNTGSKIKITSVSPGLVATEATTKEDLSPEAKAILEKMAILQTEDIADGVVYVLSTPEHVQVHELTIHPVGAL